MTVSLLPWLPFEPYPNYLHLTLRAVRIMHWRGAYTSEPLGLCQPERSERYNSFQDRVWETRVGEIPLRILELRGGATIPAWLSRGVGLCSAPPGPDPPRWRFPQQSGHLQSGCEALSCLPALVFNTPCPGNRTQNGMRPPTAAVPVTPSRRETPQDHP